MKILAIVSSCTECTNRQYYSGGSYTCSKVDAPLPKTNQIPDWCPLPEDPARLAAIANKKLSDAKTVLKHIIQAVGSENGLSQDRLLELLQMAVRQLDN